MATFPTSLLAIAACCGLAYGGLSTSAAYVQGGQEWDDLFAFRSLVARGQDAEASAAETEPRTEPERREEPENPFEDHLETDRDSFTPTTTTVTRGRFIVESAYTLIDNRHTFDTNSFPELVVRYGLSERFELRLGWNYLGWGLNSFSARSFCNAAIGWRF